MPIPTVVSEGDAREMATVGAVVSHKPLESGQRLDLAGTPAIILGEITQAEFLERVAGAGLPVERFVAQLPTGMYFFRISVD